MSFYMFSECLPQISTPFLEPKISPGRSFEYIRYTASTTMTLIILFTTITAASIAATTFDNANNDNHAMKQNRKIYFR